MQNKFPALLHGYLKDAKTYLETIEQSIPNDNLLDIINASHSLKSASGLLGLIEVHKHAEILEYKAKNFQENQNNPDDDLMPDFQNLQNAFDSVQRDLQTALANPL